MNPAGRPRRPNLVAADPVPLPRAAAWTGLAVLAVLLLVLAMHLLWALLSALATYSLSRALMRRLQPRLPHRAAAAVSVIVTLTLLAALAEAGIAAVHATWVPSGGLPRLLATLADTLDKLQSWLPEWIASRIPASTEDLRRVASEWLRSNAHQLRNWGHSGLRIVAQLLNAAAAGDRLRPLRCTMAHRAADGRLLQLHADDRRRLHRQRELRHHRHAQPVLHDADQRRHVAHLDDRAAAAAAVRPAPGRSTGGCGWRATPARAGSRPAPPSAPSGAWPAGGRPGRPARTAPSAAA
jgi:hypothetical protein